MFVFKNKFNKYGVQFDVRMLSVNEAMGLENLQDDDMYSIIANICTNEDGTNVFQSTEDVKNQLPPAIIEEIVMLSTGQTEDKKKAE
jgi:hypothetical protein